MLCDECQKSEAMVHIGPATSVTLESRLETDVGNVDWEELQKFGEQVSKERHLCKECADAFYASTPGMNSMRGLICLSDFFRAKLYDLLEAEHPEAFYDGEDEREQMREMEIKSDFLRKELKAAGIEVNEDAFGMLVSYFCFTSNYYNRLEEVKKRRGDAEN